METFNYYFVLFISYSILGWLCETICCSFHEKKLILNRGFLIGPYCPIYGYGALFMILFLKKYLNDPIVLFVMAVLGASILEYITSYIMEKVFKARWWDYSKEPFNLNGRICLKNCILFGILGLVVMYIINPFYANMLSKLSSFALQIITIILLFIFLADNITSFVIMFQIRSNATLLLQDSTNEISKQIKEILRKNRILKKRLLEAFPHAKILEHDKLLNTIRNQLKKLEEIRRK